MRFSRLALWTAYRMPSFFYAVAKGRKPGIYHTWDACKSQVHKFPGPVYKKFSSLSEAEEFVRNRSGSSGTVKSLSSLSSSGTSRPLPKTVYALGKGKSSLAAVDTELSEQPASKRRKVALDDGSVRTEAGFIVDEEGYTAVYTDGACSKNGAKGAKAGIGVWFSDGHPLNVSEPLEGVATNNKAEIGAVITAARQAKLAGISKLRIHTDSQFLISCVTKWMQKWKRNGWKTTVGNVKNKTELLELEKTLTGLDIAWRHVNGHVGIYGNEMADKLAREGCADYKHP